MKCLKILNLDLCRELFFPIMCVYLLFTTHPVGCIQILEIRGIVDYTQTGLLSNLPILHHLNFTIFPTIYASVMLILFRQFY